MSRPFYLILYSYKTDVNLKFIWMDSDFNLLTKHYIGKETDNWETPLCASGEFHDSIRSRLSTSDWCLLIYYPSHTHKDTQLTNQVSNWITFCEKMKRHWRKCEITNIWYNSFIPIQIDDSFQVPNQSVRLIAIAREAWEDHVMQWCTRKLFSTRTPLW